MRMIPASPYDNQSRAELVVFDRLKAAFSRNPELRLTAFHSLNLTRHATRRFGVLEFIAGMPPQQKRWGSCLTPSYMFALYPRRRWDRSTAGLFATLPGGIIL